MRDKDEKLNIQKGKNVLYAKLPKEILNIGEYRISISAGLHHICYIIPPEMEIPILSFAITGMLGTSFGDDTRNCPIVKLIPWNNSTQ